MTLGNSLDTLAEIQWRCGQTDQAEATLRKALATATLRSGGFRRSEAGALTHFADFLLDMGRTGEARDILQDRLLNDLGDPRGDNRGTHPHGRRRRL